jgi:putative ABC transport system permease protein
MVFDPDNWAEIFSVIQKNKLRTFLTGFSISWGIFMFCILLASGNGLKNGVTSNFSGQSMNSIELWGRRTSKPYKGFPEQRSITFNSNDLELIKNQIPESEYISGTCYNNVLVNYNTFNTSCLFMGVSSDYSKISGIKIKKNGGRFISEADMKETRKVAVINNRLQKVLFQNEDPIGKLFTADGIGYTVIGVFETDFDRDDAAAYIPYSTALLLYNGGWSFRNLSFTAKGLNTMEKNEAFKTRLRKKLADLHVFDPEDERAIGMWAATETYLQTMGIFNGISMFIWIIGSGTLIAGVVSISNIMLITVRERTREFGIRKALGAKPSSILGSILMESTLITSIFGYFGMFLGVGFGELVNSALENASAAEMSFVFKNPTVEVAVAVVAMCILIIAGIIAGYYPALKAVKISAVEAMREK